MSSRGSGGFTLIEVLIVILIIGILAAIAVPALLGQRGKARVRVMETSTKAMERELRMIIDHYDQRSPLLFSTIPSQIGCYQHINAKDPNVCSLVYPDITFTGTYQNLSDIVNLYVEQQNIGLNARSPYDNSLLLTEDASPASRDGHILITNTSDDRISVSAWSQAGSEILSVAISSR